MPPKKEPSSDQVAGIRLLVLDVDGVLTDGQIHYDADGREAKSFSVRDGYGIKRAMAAGITVAIISGRSSKAVEVRMAELGIEHVRLGQDDKLAALNEITARLSIPLSETACIGDDMPDLPIMESSLSHIRRDRIREAPGIRLERDTDGRVTKVIVEQLGT